MVSILVLLVLVSPYVIASMTNGQESQIANHAIAQTSQDISENIAAALNQTATEVANQTTLQVLEDVRAYLKP
jgi:hypothetical protein